MVAFSRINYKSSANTIFIWGDSQAKAGFDLIKIRQMTGKEVYSSALGGAGVIDFLVFTETVPMNSSVYISISQLAQLRERDKNQSGIPFRSLYKIILLNYNEILPVFRENIKPSELFVTSAKLYPYRDTLTFHEPISKFEEIYSHNNGQIKIKQQLFLSGLKRLLQKHCTITFVEFPFHPILSEVLRNSNLKMEFSGFSKDLIGTFNNFEIDSLTIHSEKRMMYDLSHLNKFGAGLITEEIFKRESKNNNSTKYYVINGGICE